MSLKDIMQVHDSTFKTRFTAMSHQSQQPAKLRSVRVDTVLCNDSRHLQCCLLAAPRE